MALIKHAFALTAGLLALNAQAAASYIPALYNFSVMYDFNPVRGPVKTLTATVKSETENYTIKVALPLKAVLMSLRVVTLINMATPR